MPSLTNSIILFCNQKLEKAIWLLITTIFVFWQTENKLLKLLRFDVKIVKLKVYATQKTMLKNEKFTDLHIFFVKSIYSKVL